LFGCAIYRQLCRSSFVCISTANYFICASGTRRQSEFGCRAVDRVTQVSNLEASFTADSLRLSRFVVTTSTFVAVCDQTHRTSQLLSACLQRCAAAADTRHIRVRDDYHNDNWLTVKSRRCLITDWMTHVYIHLTYLYHVSIAYSYTRCLYTFRRATPKPLAANKCSRYCIAVSKVKCSRAVEMTRNTVNCKFLKVGSLQVQNVHDYVLNIKQPIYSPEERGARVRNCHK